MVKKPGERTLFDFFEEDLPLLSVDDIYERADQSLLKKLGEDNRVERKPAGIHCETLGDYFSMWANTAPEGGLVVVGMENNGELTGCSHITQSRLNDLERTGDVYCPDARYQTRRLEVSTATSTTDFVLLIRVAYRTDRLVRTVKGEAFARRGETKKKLTEEEKRELEIDKGQVQFEKETCGIAYPQEFDADQI